MNNRERGRNREQNRAPATRAQTECLVRKTKVPMTIALQKQVAGSVLFRLKLGHRIRHCLVEIAWSHRPCVDNPGSSEMPKQSDLQRLERIQSQKCQEVIGLPEKCSGPQMVSARVSTDQTSYQGTAPWPEILCSAFTPEDKTRSPLETQKAAQRKKTW